MQTSSTLIIIKAENKQTDLQDVGGGVVVLVEQEPLVHSGDAVVGELLGDEVAGHALQRLQGQLARVVDGHSVAR